MTLSFREMTADDLDAVLHVRLSTRENAVTLQELEEDYGVTPTRLAAAMRRDVRGWLCEDGSEVVGFSMGDLSNGEVQVVAVLPDYEGKGIGKELLSRVCDWLHSEGWDEIWLKANPDPEVRASGFYERLGWKATGEAAGYDHILKRKLTR